MQIKVLGLPREGRSTIANLIAQTLTDHGIQHQLHDGGEELLAGDELKLRVNALSNRLQGTDDRITIMTGNI